MVDLDLNELTKAPVLVKLPDNNNYELADPMNMSAHQYHRLMNMYNEANSIMQKDENEVGEETVKEMEELLKIVCRTILPTAPHDVVDNLGLGQQNALIDKFGEGVKNNVGEEESEGKAIANHTE